MHVLLLVTAHNSLSQRVALLLSDLSQPDPPPGPALQTSTSFASDQRFQAGPSRPTPNPNDENLSQTRSPSKITYTIELASTPSTIIEAVRLAKPDVIVCPFLTKRVPREVYAKYLTLILHPGPPGDAGPSALDWVLSGDDGTEADAEIALKKIMKASEWDSDRPADQTSSDLKGKGREGTGRRRWWGVTCLQAEEELDEGPTWAFEQFQIPPSATKSSLYRDGVSSAACLAILTALGRIEKAYLAFERSPPPPAMLLSTPQSLSRGRMSTAQSMSTIRTAMLPEKKPDLFDAHTPRYPTNLVPPYDSGTHTTRGYPSRILHTQHRPLLKASERAPDPAFHTAEKCASLIRAADSQPGVLTKMFGNKGLFVYGAHVQSGGAKTIEQLDRIMIGRKWDEIEYGQIAATRQGAVLIKTVPGAADAKSEQGLGIWITHARLPMPKETKLLPPKLPSCEALLAANLKHLLVDAPEWDLGTWQRVMGTFQQVWIDEERLECPEGGSVLYIHFDFYNGACSTAQCRSLLDAIVDSVDQAENKVRGSRNYFSNGIALNVIEGHADPSAESWRNIQAIDDVVELILGDSSAEGKTYRSEFLRGVPSLAERGILTISAIQANAAAGGLALATCADIVLCSANAVLNPHYRGVGLFGSEFHTYHWPARVGQRKFAEMARAMMPVSPREAEQMGLIDCVVGSRLSDQDEIEMGIKQYVKNLGWARAGESDRRKTAPWVKRAGQESSFPGLSLIDAYIENKLANHQALAFPLVFFRNEELSQMLLDFYHPSRSERYHSRRQAFVRKFASRSTPLRFAEHRRFRSDGLTHKHDPEELAVYEDAPGWVRGEEWRWAKECVPEGFLGFGGLDEIYAEFGGRALDTGLALADRSTETTKADPAPTKLASVHRSISPRKAVPAESGDQSTKVLSGDVGQVESASSALMISGVHLGEGHDMNEQATRDFSGPRVKAAGKRDSFISFGQAAPAIHRYVPTASGPTSASSAAQSSVLVQDASPAKAVTGSTGPRADRHPNLQSPSSGSSPSASGYDSLFSEDRSKGVMRNGSARVRKSSLWEITGRSSRRPSSSSGVTTLSSNLGGTSSSADGVPPRADSGSGSGFRGSIRKALGLRGPGNQADTVRFDALHADAGQGYPHGAIHSPTTAFPLNGKNMQGHYAYKPAIFANSATGDGTMRENQSPQTSGPAAARKSLDAGLFARARVVSVEGKDGRIVMTQEEADRHPEVLFPCYYTPATEVTEPSR